MTALVQAARTLALDFRPGPLPYPAPAGPHALAWAAMLDRVVADASRQGVAGVQVIGLPAALEADLRLRAETVQVDGQTGQAVLTCGPRLPELSGVDRLYTVSGGLLAPRALRWNPQPSGFVAQSSRALFSLRARAWGLPIRLAYLLRRPDLADRAGFAMRRDFSGPADQAGFYICTVWGRA